MYPGDGKAQCADSGLLLIEGLALCDQRRTGLSVCPGDGGAQRADSGLLLIDGLALCDLPDGSFHLPKRYTDSG